MRLSMQPLRRNPPQHGKRIEYTQTDGRGNEASDTFDDDTRSESPRPLVYHVGPHPAHRHPPAICIAVYHFVAEPADTALKAHEPSELLESAAYGSAIIVFLFCVFILVQRFMPSRPGSNKYGPSLRYPHG